MVMQVSSARFLRMSTKTRRGRLLQVATTINVRRPGSVSNGRRDVHFAVPRQCVTSPNPKGDLCKKAPSQAERGALLREFVGVFERSDAPRSGNWDYCRDLLWGRTVDSAAALGRPCMPALGCFGKARVRRTAPPRAIREKPCRLCGLRHDHLDDQRGVDQPGAILAKQDQGAAVGRHGRVIRSGDLVTRAIHQAHHERLEGRGTHGQLDIIFGHGPSVPRHALTSKPHDRSIADGGPGRAQREDRFATCLRRSQSPRFRPGHFNGWRGIGRDGVVVGARTGGAPPETGCKPVLRERLIRCRCCSTCTPPLCWGSCGAG